jgi:GTP-binding protein
MDVFLCGRPVRLIDTGGFKLETDGLDELVVGRTLETLERADLIIFMVEAGAVTPEDEEFIGRLRPFQDRVLVAVNKTEGGRLSAEAWNLLAYGFEKVYLISAEHGDNVGDLEAAAVARLDFSKVETAEPSGYGPIRVALLGKPNTGKSTLSNRLTASEASIVSSAPGTTRDVVEGGFSYKNRLFKILDTAGIRRKSKVSENVEYYSVNRAIKALDDADIIFLMIDAQEGLSDQDKKIAALAHDKGRGIIFTLNKWDMMPQTPNTFQAAADRVRFLFGKMEYAPVVPISAQNGTGADKLLNTALTMYAQLTRRIETGRLNQSLARWQEEYPPPIGPHTRFSIKYGVQVSDNPVKFVLFASRPQAVSEPYRAYLRNRLRQDLGFSMIPLEIEIRPSGRSPQKS